MNVAFDPWIPVVTTAGKRTLASLCDVLTKGDQYADLAVRPHERVSLMRLFLCVAHAALNGPKDYDEWCEVPKKLPDTARSYLSKWKDSFELFHSEKPWLQVRDLTGDKVSPIALLDFELATGNNTTLHDHSGQTVNREIKAEKIALTLLTFQNFSSGGGAPIAQWKTVKTSQVGNPDAPCLSQSMAHSLFRGRTLAETFHLNLPALETAKKLYKGLITHKKDKAKGKWDWLELTDIEIGKPVWEFFPDEPDSNSAQAINATSTYLGRLVPVARWIRLINQSEMYCCNGFKYLTFKDGFPSEPTAAVQLVKKRDKKRIESIERKVLKMAPAKALWRELSAVLVKRSAFGLGGPLAMENVPSDSNYDFHVCAMTRNQASMDIAVESVFHITPAIQFNLPSYQAEVGFAERLSKKLGRSIETYRREIDGDWQNRLERSREKWVLIEKLHSTATNHFWTTVEKNLSLLMAHINAIDTDDAIPTRNTWRKMLCSAAFESYSLACGRGTPRQIRAYAKGLQKLTPKKQQSATNIREEVL